MDHIIHTQLLDISISHVSRANEVQRSLSDHFWNGILPELNKLFDELCKGNEVLSIEHLEIDLGKILYKDVLKKNINSSWIQQIQEQIRKYVVPSQSKTEKRGRRITLPQHSLDQWIFYMKNGYLPWSINKLPNQWERQILEQLASDYYSIQQFRNYLAANPEMILRIVRQHDESFLISLLESILAESQKQLVYIINYFVNQIVSVSENNKIVKPQKFRIKESIWKLLFEKSISEPLLIKKYLWIPIWLKKVEELNWIAFNNELRYQEYNMMIDGLDISSELKDAIKLELIKQFNSNTSYKKESDVLIRYDSERLKEEEIEEIKEQNLTRIFSEELIKKNNGILFQNPKPEDKDEIDDGYYFSHVGLILLHPFITILFKRLAYIESGKFVSEESQLRAIYLLHYIVSGSIQPKEFELAIPKLLCGVDLPIVVNPCPDFRKEELEEAELMIQGAIDQWKPGLFSVSALRYNFLQRSGFWKVKNDQIILQMEKSSIDILLKTFPVPWNLSIVKFPWLKKLIVVEWV